MNPTVTLACSSALVLALAACGKPAEPDETPSSSSARTPATAASSAPVAPVTAAVPPTPAPAPTPSGPLASTLHPDLLDPTKASQKAPDVFKAKFTTTKGEFVVEVHRDWSPNGADRFYNLVKLGFYDDTRFFRAVPKFMVQFGISGDPAVSRKWQTATIQDDSPAATSKQSNKRSYVTFAKTGAPNSRTSQIFLNTVDNPNLDGMGFTPFGQVTKGMEVVDSLYTGYGDGMNQGAIQSQGNAFLDAQYPKLDGVKHAEIVAK
jgi:peptidyl-prolyl cis-trans isomerase A (cyclophilin A)